MKLGKFILVATIDIVLCLILFSLSMPSLSAEQIEQQLSKADIHEPTEELRKKWSMIEDMLIEKDPETIRVVNSLLSELVKQENDITVLLEQKASTQMGCISIVIAIVLAILGFSTKGSLKFLSRRQKNLFLFFNSIIIVIFIFSMYWSHQGFTVRGDFASYNVDDLFDIMKDKDSDLITFWVSNILENYQIYIVNSAVNESKADLLTLAARSFIVGIIGFAVVSLVFMTKGKFVVKKKEVVNDGKREKQNL